MKGKVTYDIYNGEGRFNRPFPTLEEAIDWRMRNGIKRERILVSVRHKGKSYNYCAGELLLEISCLNDN